MTKKELALEILATNKDQIFDLITNNISYKAISEKFGVNVRYVHEFLHQEENEEMTKACLEVASEEQIEKARHLLESINEDDNNAIVRKKSELSQFELYLAKVKNRRKFDLNYREDKHETNNSIITPQLTLKVVNNSNNQLKLENNE